MKKALSLILALVLCLSLCACGGEYPTETKEKEEIKEEVWVRTRRESINDEGYVFMHSEDVYNEDGELVSHGIALYGSVLFEDDLADYTHEYDFDEHNNLTEMRVFFEGIISETYTFNSDGYITEFKDYTHNKYETEGKLSERQVYEYDEAGRLVMSVDYTGSGELDEKIMFKYREDGTCEEYSCYEEGVLLYITECDELGRPYYTQYYNSKAHTYSYKHVYDSYGNLTETFQYFGSSSKEQSHTRYTYQKIRVTPLQKMIIEAKNKLSILSIY